MEEFELDTYLMQNLRIKKFNKYDNNYYLVYDKEDGDWLAGWDYSFQSHFIYFKEVEKEVLKTLTEKGITMRELREAYKKLGWI